MTNNTIILNNSLELMEQGILKGSGQFIDIETADGIKTIELPEAIHTFNGWKALGFKVKKGEKSKIKFSIWKHSSKKTVDENGEEQVNSRMFMQSAAWFTAEQVEPIKA